MTTPDKIIKSVLVVDDDSQLRALVSLLLRSMELAVIEAGSAKEAAGILAASTADPLLAIIDYRMPEMDGISWITELRDAGRTFPIVLLTSAWCDEETFHRLRNILKVNLILRKPIEPEQFVKDIEQLLPAIK